MLMKAHSESGSWQFTNINLYQLWVVADNLILKRYNYLY